MDPIIFYFIIQTSFKTNYKYIGSCWWYWCFYPMVGGGIPIHICTAIQAMTGRGDYKCPTLNLNNRVIKLRSWALGLKSWAECDLEYKYGFNKIAANFTYTDKQTPSLLTLSPPSENNMKTPRALEFEIVELVAFPTNMPLTLAWKDYFNFHYIQIIIRFHFYWITLNIWIYTIIIKYIGL